MFVFFPVVYDQLVGVSRTVFGADVGAIHTIALCVRTDKKRVALRDLVAGFCELLKSMSDLTFSVFFKF